MGYQDDYVMRTISDLVRAIARLVLGKSDIDYDLPEDEDKYTDLDRRPLESRLPEPQASLPWPRPCGTGVLYSTVCMQFAELHLQSSVITAERAYPLIPLWNVLQARRDHG